MTSMSPGAAVAIEERRERYASAAAVEIRRNRPRHLLVLAMVLLLVACITLMWSLSSRNAARDDLEQARRQAANIERLVGEWRALKADGADAGKMKLNEPLTTFYSKIETAATKAGVKELIPSPQPQGDSRDVRTGAVQKKIRYQRVLDADLGALVRWMEGACEDVPGLQVYALRVQPLTAQGLWQVDVTFSRWERPNR